MKRAISLITLFSFALSILTLNVNYVFATWDGTSVAMSYARGTGTESDPYVITKPEQLALLAQKVNGGESYNGCFFELGANIDLGGKEWTPIGTKSKPFKASFDGKGFSVGAFMITEDSLEYAAFIGYADGEDAVIKNFVIETAIIKSSKAYASGFIGYSSVKELKSITVRPDVVVKGHKTVGGVVGYLHQSDATYLVNYATLVGIGDGSTPVERIGGIAGFIISPCTISYSANHGHISGYGRSMGGIVGYASDMNGDATIESCYNTASIESISIAKAPYVGGIVGYVNQFNKNIFLCNNCYNLSDDITAAVNEAAVGSILGYTHAGGGRLKRCYSVNVPGLDSLHGCGEFGSVTLLLSEFKEKNDILVLTNGIDDLIEDNRLVPPPILIPETEATTTQPVPPATGDVSAVILAAVCVTCLAAVMVARKKER